MRLIFFNALSFESRFCCTLSSISAQILSGVASSRSSVRPTTPSVEFSTGTTVNWVAPDSQRRNASSTDAAGSAPTARPKCLRTACSLNVPSGPR